MTPVDYAQYNNASQQRLIKAQLLLIQCEHPLRLKDIAEHLNTSEPTALRDMYNLAQVGWAKYTPDGLWVTGQTWEALKQIAIKEFKADLHKLIDDFRGFE